MIKNSKSPRAVLMAAVLAGSTSIAWAQEPQGTESDVLATVPVTDSAEMTAGPEVKGFISARSGSKVQITTAGGEKAVVTVTDATQIRGSGGFLGLGRSRLGNESLLNGLPITAKTLQSGGELVASQISLQNKDLRTASMIHSGTAQRFDEQTAATEALRGRMGDIDKYNVKATTNVNFDTGKFVLSEDAKHQLCAAANTAEGMDNALLLVVGYTDSTGSQDFNQVLSEKRASRVVNHLQQACGWKPYRMLTPTGMATADPLASNDTAEGKFQNRRVAVNILVSKAVDGF